MGTTIAQKLRYLTDGEFEDSIREMPDEELKDLKSVLESRKSQAESEKIEREKLIENQIDNPGMEHLIDMSIKLTSDDYEIPQLNLRINAINKELSNR